MMRRGARRNGGAPTTADVMRVYKRVNPSFVEQSVSVEGWRSYRRTWARFITEKMLLPPVAFRGRTLLDVGCGTGEKALVYASLGARVTGLDANELALAKAQALAKRIGLSGSATFRLCDVAKLPPGSGFDLVISDGMLHHTPDPWGGLGRVAARVAPGGCLVLGLAEPCGFFQRKLQRYFVNRIAGDDESLKATVAMAIFGKIMRRASKRSGRSVESTLHDSFINPLVTPMDSRRIAAVLAKKDFAFDLAWPPLALPLQADSQYHPVMSRAHGACRAAEATARALWLINDIDDLDRFAKSPRHDQAWLENLSLMASETTDRSWPVAQAERLCRTAPDSIGIPRLKRDIAAEAKRLLEEAVSADRTISAALRRGAHPLTVARQLKFRRLFAGFSGVGMVYYRFTKKELA